MTAATRSTAPVAAPTSSLFPTAREGRGAGRRVALTPAAILEGLRDIGVTLTLDGERIVGRGAVGAVGAELGAAVKANKAGIRELLRALAEPAPTYPCATCPPAGSGRPRFAFHRPDVTCWWCCRGRTLEDAS